MLSFARSLATAAVMVPVLSLAGCLALDGKATRNFTGSEPKPAKLVIESRFLDIDLSVATSESVGVDASIVLETTGGNETAEREIEKCMVHLDREGDTLFVRQGKKGEKIGVTRWSGSGSLKVALPAGVPFVIDSASGNVRMVGDYGSVAASVSAASGNITADLGVDSMKAGSASGDVSLSFRSALTSLECESASGNVTAKAPSIAKGIAKAASGRIDIMGLAGPFKASAASGNVRLQFVEFPASADSTVSAASGNIDIVLPKGAEPSGSISTASGSVTLGVPGTKGRGSAKLTGSGAKLSISAASGNVKVAPATAEK